MTSPLQQLFYDLQDFAVDLRGLFSTSRLKQATRAWSAFRHDRRRRLPLLCTVGLHLGALLLTLITPLFTAERVRIPEVYRVELFNAVEAPAPPPAPVAVTTPVPKPTPAPPPAPAQVVKPRAMSLSPIKQRLVKERQEREAQESQARLLANRMEQIKLELQQKQAEEAARTAASQAISKIADLYRTTAPPPAAPSQPADRRQKQEMATNEAALQGAVGDRDPRQLEALERFKVRLIQHMAPNWQLPDLQDWDERLSATVIMRVKGDGQVTSSWFEKHSGNSLFDQYVKKAVDLSAPLPPLPMELNRTSEEIAVTFTPVGLR